MADSEHSAERTHAYATEAKVKAVLRVLRGEDVRAVAGDIGASESRLSRWQREFVAGGKSQIAKSHKTRGHRIWKQLKKDAARVFPWIGLLLALYLSISWILKRVYESSGE
ncbi:MAG: helix-turn-helix domain-containing protein [Acidobacteria bacterium]|nr:helix-turn-helix domain-containing protein [Acidobacteriota bacterium]